MIRRLFGLLGRQSIAILALCVAVSGGTAYAASSMWTGANIVDGSLSGADIQNGSITSADLAPGSGSGGGVAALATIDVPGPVAISAADAQAGPITIASQSFTTTSAGFVDIRYAATLTAPQDVCGIDAYWSTNLYVSLDGGAKIAGVYLDRGPVSSMPNRSIGSAWLPAGAHTVEITSADTSCDAPNGSFQATEIHASVAPSA